MIQATTPAHRFRAIGTTHEILVTRPETLSDALEVAKAHLAAVDLACSRFRSDSEVNQLAHDARFADAGRYATPLFLDYLRAAQHAAHVSDGLVDFTVGSALIAAGYDQDLDRVRERTNYTRQVAPVPGWQRIHISRHGRVTTPQGTVLDFGASAKAHAADQIARTLALRMPGGFLVNLGGDIATSGDVPDGGWSIAIEAADTSVRQVVAITDQAIATSSTQRRTWVTDRGTANHIIDPRNGQVVQRVWGQVTCVGTTALEANTASTAALVLGESAPQWLELKGIPARLERRDGRAEFVGDWPDPQSEEEAKKP